MAFDDFLTSEFGRRTDDGPPPPAPSPAEGGTQRDQRTASSHCSLVSPRPPASIPDYLPKHYWWAYVHPNAIRFFERQWLINLILLGNYAQLRESAMEALGPALPGSTLQVASAYGNVTERLYERVLKGAGRLDVIDVLPLQIENLRKKLPPCNSLRTFVMDAADLDFAEASYDRALLFFLLHEQPDSWRRKTLAGTLRVVKPGGRIVIVEYALPQRWNPIRYLFPPALRLLEPFALDLWRNDIASFMPASYTMRNVARQTVFGGLYQVVAFDR